MTNSAGPVKRGAPGKKGGAWKSKAKVGECLHGARGIIFTFGDPSKTSHALRDMMNILDRTVEELSSKGASKKSKLVESDNLEDAMAAELAELKESRDRFTPFKDLCKCVGFVRFNEPEDDPITIVNHMFEDAIATQVAKSRFICSVIPIAHSTKPHKAEFEVLGGKLVDEELLPLGASRSAEAPLGWKVSFNSRNNKTIPRTDAQDFMGGRVMQHEDRELAAKFKVNLTEPEVCVLIENNPKFCGLSVVQNWVRFKNYNLMRAAGEELDCTKKMLEKQQQLAKAAEEAEEGEAEEEAKEEEEAEVAEEAEE